MKVNHGLCCHGNRHYTLIIMVVEDLGVLSIRCLVICTTKYCEGYNLSTFIVYA